MTLYRRLFLLPIALALGSAASAQGLPDDYWEFLRSYDDELLYIHPLMNYAFDLEWRYEWERRQLADNGVRAAGGSVAADSLLTLVDMNINQPMNDRWRFQGRFHRVGSRHRASGDEQLFLGAELNLFESSGAFLMFNPQYNKEFMDIAMGYTFYRSNREEYVRVGLMLEDFAYDSKNDMDGVSAHNQMAIQWKARWAIGNDWFLYSEGDVGNGYERTYDDPRSSPLIAYDKKRENVALVRVSRFDDDGTGWSAWIDWYELEEAQDLRLPDIQYDYVNRIYNISFEHTRIHRDRHRWRFLVHYVDQQAVREGHSAHTYDRRDLMGGVFYEYLWPTSGLTFAYAFTQPDATLDFGAPNVIDGLQGYSDKIMVGWRYEFSREAQIRFVLSHEVSNIGFGGGSVQFQMFF